MKEIEFMQLLLEDAKQELEYKNMFDEAQELANIKDQEAYDRWLGIVLHPLQG